MSETAPAVTSLTRFSEISFHRLLLVLYEKDELSMTDLSKRAILCKQTVLSCVSSLLNLGLVKERRTSGLPSKRLISLTESGDEVAELMIRILYPEDETSSRIATRLMNSR